MGYNKVEVPFSGGHPAHYAGYGRMVGRASVALVDRWGPDAGPLSEDPAQRASAREYLYGLVDCADALGAEVTAGRFHASRGASAAQKITEREWGRLVESQTEMADHAPMRLAITPLRRRERSRLISVVDASRLVRAVNRPNYAYLFDINRAQIDEIGPVTALDATLPEVGHVHVSLNHSRTPGYYQRTTLRALNRLRSASYGQRISVDAFAEVEFSGGVRTAPLSQQTQLALDAVRTIRQSWKQ